MATMRVRDIKEKIMRTRTTVIVLATTTWMRTAVQKYLPERQRI